MGHQHGAEGRRPTEREEHAVSDDQPEIHETHDPEPEDAPVLYKGGRACRRCGFFVCPQLFMCYSLGLIVSG